MIDTINFRLYGINDMKSDNVSELKFTNKGISQLCVIEHQMLFWKMLEYKGKSFVIRQVFNKKTNEYSLLNEEDYLKKVLSPDEEIVNFYDFQHGFMNVNEKGKDKTFGLQTRGSMGNLETEILERANGEVRTPSSISYVQFKLNPNGRYIEFEFSIPKYLYGHSLAQFIPQPQSENFAKYGFSKMCRWEYQTKFIYSSLIEFIKKFLNDLCLMLQLEIFPNMNYIEIRRIDLCYNQFFDSKEQALASLEQKRKLYRKKQRLNSRKINETSYDTTIQYRSSSGSYFKIYHKGTEYSKTDGDRGKHLKINNEFLDRRRKIVQKETIKKFEEKLSGKLKYDDHLKIMRKYFSDFTLGKVLIDKETLKEVTPYIKYIQPKLPFDVVYLKTEMDKVLRYEVSLSKNFFKDHYKTKIFRKDDLAHQNGYKIYKRVKTVYDSRTRDDYQVSKFEHRIYTMFNQYLNRRVALLLVQNKSHPINYFENSSVSPFYEDYDREKKVYNISQVKMNSKTALFDTDVGVFSEKMLLSCIKHFRQLIDYFKISVIEPLDDFSVKVQQYNDKVEQNLFKYNNQDYVLETGFNIHRPMYKKGKKITKPSQLLTDAQKRDKCLQKVNITPLLAIVEHVDKGHTMIDFFKKHNIKSSTAHRYKKQLEKFEIFENSLVVKMEVKEFFDWNRYYLITSEYKNKNRFYFKGEHINMN